MNIKCIIASRFAPTFIFLLILTTGCQEPPSEKKHSFETYLSEDEITTPIKKKKTGKATNRPSYPWDPMLSNTPRINKYHFCCRGSIEHPVYQTDKGWFSDCAGGQVHSLPLREDEEWISPVLIVLLNDLQDYFQTTAQVQCGHCCPIHYRYRIEKGERAVRRHMIGAAVDFTLKHKSVDDVIPYLIERVNLYSSHPLSSIDPAYAQAPSAWKNKHFKIHTLDNYSQEKSKAIRIEVFHDPILDENIRFQWDATEQLFIY